MLGYTVANMAFVSGTRLARHQSHTLHGAADATLLHLTVHGRLRFRRTLLVSTSLFVVSFTCVEKYISGVTAHFAEVRHSAG